MRTSLHSVVAMLGACAIAGTAFGQQASLRSGNIALGVDTLGQLNISDRYDLNPRGSALGVTLTTLGDGTSPGCLCEGWGVSGSGVAGYANNSSGTAGLSLISFTSDDTGAGPGTTATSTVQVTGLPALQVSQQYAPAAAAPTALFQNTVTISNTGASTITDVRYVRVMDWDIPTTEFSEYVTIQGTATTAFLELSHDDGFETSNPLAATGAILGGTTDVDFVDSGPADHGAYFKFNFGDLDAGESITFSIFYGAALNQAGALAALGAVGAELYSFGQRNSTDRDDQATFIFAFKGVGGEIIVPPPTGVPDAGSTVAMFGLALAALGFVRRKMA